MAFIPQPLCLFRPSLTCCSSVISNISPQSLNHFSPILCGERVLRAPFKSFDLGWVVAALLPLVGILLAFNGSAIIDTADGLFHTHRILAMTQLLAAGDLYPRWIPWFHLGYGYPVFNFYAPAASYLGGVMGLAGVSAALAYNLIAAACWVLGSLGIYALGRYLLSGTAAIVAVALWAYAPSRLQDVWNVGNLSGFIGTALLPWLFFTLAHAVNSPGRRTCAWLALAFGGVVLAHQPTTVLAALVVAPGLLAACLWVGRHDRDTILPRLLWVGGGLALGFGISLIFSLPMLLETQYIKVSLPAEDIPSVLQSNFLFPGDLFLPATAPDLGDVSRRLPDTFGLLAGVLGALGFIALPWRRRYGLALGWGAAVGFCIFLLLEPSLDFWLTVPLLGQLRFPARVLRLGVVFLALLGGSSLLLIPRRFQAPAAGLLVALVILDALPMVYASQDWVDYANITPRDEIQYELDTFAFGGTSYNEFKPIWSTGTPYDTPADMERYIDHPMQVDYIDPHLTGVTIQQVGDRMIQVSTPSAFELSFRHFYFPGWFATIDDAPAEVYPASEYGLITLNVPPGEHTIELHRNNTPVQHIAPLLSLVSLGIVVMLLVRGQPVVAQAVEPAPPRLSLVIGVGVLAFAVLNLLIIEPRTTWFRQHSPPDSPAAMQVPVHQTFGDAYELLGYTLDQREVAPGDSLRITLYWRALRPLDHTYQPRLQLVNNRHTEAWGATEGFFVGARPELHTPGYFTLDEHRLQVFPDAPPYTASITIKLIDPQTGEALALPDGNDTYTLPETVRISGTHPAVERVLPYQVGDSLELWCVAADRNGDQLRVTLYWHVVQPITTPDVRAFVHALDAAGEVVEQGDGEPLNGNYPLVDWLPDQNLADVYTLPANPAIQQLAIGLYLPERERLAVTDDGRPVTDNRILVSLEDSRCGGS